MARWQGGVKSGTDQDRLAQCDGCGRVCRRRDLQRSGLRWYCRYCLDGDMVPVSTESALAKGKTCYVCGGLGGCPDCGEE